MKIIYPNSVFQRQNVFVTPHGRDSDTVSVGICPRLLLCPNRTQAYGRLCGSAPQAHVTPFCFLQGHHLFSENFLLLCLWWFCFQRDCQLHSSSRDSNCHLPLCPLYLVECFAPSKCSINIYGMKG